ncbi:helix-turn-helix transcriptional regulator [Pseudoduganella sp. SL102]|uniref:XRE family transcriptional regulator n=1 Tax=Pseudoduganella sp. SL102 TaxID=2995154 RepID=UPI00248BE83F|nr:helix-turn-helix transcriptional regulator [Pseudoduganella sp. SL102]WBS00243.1 helix-turn-helix transcriptional regulator [Pseudoduganella sp. SL102]
MGAIMGTPVIDVNRYSGSFPGENIGMSIGNRLKLARKAAKMSQVELAKRSGLNQSTISDLEVGKSQGSTSLATLAAILGVNALWLETGKGPMLLTEAPPGLAGLPPGSFMRVEAVDDDDPRLTLIPKVKLRLSAGISGFEVEPERFDGSTVTVPTDWLVRKGYVRDNLIGIHVSGESMEPTLYDGDLVVVNIADKHGVDGGIYAFNYEGEAVVKRLTRDAGRWWLTSDNPDQRKYHRKVCEGDACIIVGRVVRRESDRF